MSEIRTYTQLEQWLNKQNCTLLLIDNKHSIVHQATGKRLQYQFCQKSADHLLDTHGINMEAELMKEVQAQVEQELEHIKNHTVDPITESVSYVAQWKKLNAKVCCERCGQRLKARPYSGADDFTVYVEACNCPQLKSKGVPDVSTSIGLAHEKSKWLKLRETAIDITEVAAVCALHKDGSKISFDIVLRGGAILTVREDYVMNNNVIIEVTEMRNNLIDRVQKGH